jgi:hypothetical protein
LARKRPVPKGHPDHARLEVYLLTILLMARPFWVIGGIILLIFGIAALPMYPASSVVTLLLALFLFLLSYSYPMALHVARIWARLATLGRRRD